MTIRALLYCAASRHETGGVQAVFSRLAWSLRQRGHEIIETWPEASADPTPDEWACPLEFRTGWFGLPGPVAMLRGGWGLLHLAIGLARYRPALVNVHFVRGESLYFLLLRPLFGYRLVLSVHGSDLLRPRAVARRLLGWADGVTVVSEHLWTRVLACPGVAAERVRLIPNGIDHAFWAGIEPCPGDPPLLVFVGRLLPVKGVDVLLEALARVRLELPGTRLAIVGEGDSGDTLRRQVGSLGLGDSVDFTGHLDRMALRELLGRAAAFVLPSRSEGLPLALLEAMAAGLPAVASAVGGVPEVLSTGCGRLVPPEDPVALAGALGDLLRDPARQALGQSARARAAEFSSLHADAAYERLFLELSGGAS